jgi:hypothetical protein
VFKRGERLTFQAIPSVVWGLGIPPVISNLVATIVSEVFTAFTCLLEAHVVADAPSFSFVADQMVIRPAKRRKEITDILVTRSFFCGAN